MDIVKQNIKDRPINYISILLDTEEDCDPEEGEYSLVIISFIGGLDLSPKDGTDDISLIKECIENDVDFDKLPKEGTTEIILKESGEWEDVFWHKYYEVDRFCILGNT